MDYKDKIRKLLALAKSPEPEEAKLCSRPASLWRSTSSASGTSRNGTLRS